jgi:hypothetical protein
MATAPLEYRLLDILIHWEACRAQAPDPRAEDGSTDRPELVDERRSRIEAVRAMAPVLDSETAVQSSTPADLDPETGRRETPTGIRGRRQFKALGTAPVVLPTAGTGGPSRQRTRRRKTLPETPPATNRPYPRGVSTRSRVCDRSRRTQSTAR